MKPILFFISLMLAYNLIAQNNGPWNSPLRFAWSSDGVNFPTNAIFQDSAGVPSLIRWKSDTLICAFQWFRQPVNTPTWDRVAVKFSYNNGISWSEPKPIVINGIPTSFQRPFDPTLTVLNDNKIRIYYSSSNGLPKSGLDSTVNTYSAISSDGVNYTFEANPRVDFGPKQVIDPTVLYFQNQWHYVAPYGAPQEGAHHYTSSDGVNFVQQSLITSDNQHNWTGNLMSENADEMRFYGSGQNIWYSSTSNGINWKPYLSTNLIGGDPSVLKIAKDSYLAVYVGQPYSNTTFTCGTTFIDPRDNQRYTTVPIGSDCWFKQNLNFGKTVPSVSSNTLHSDMFNNNIPEKYAFDNDSTLLPKYGGLYEWNELMNYVRMDAAQGLCPPGWHISTDTEWKRLIAASGGILYDDNSGKGGSALKIVGEGNGKGAGTDIVGFSAKHSGDRDGFGIFYGKGLRSIFWTSTPVGTNQAIHYTLWAENDTIQRLFLGSNTGFSCRCVLNRPPTTIQEIEPQKTKWSVFPNPFEETIKVFPKDTSLLFSLKSLSGNTLWAGKQVEQQDFSHLPSGVYFLTISSEDYLETHKLIKL